MRKANVRKQFRTKFTQHQKESMFKFAQKVGWKLQKRDEELISEFCSKIGVEKQAFKFSGIFESFLLSKTWLQALFTLPNLKFFVDYWKNNRKIAVDNIMERYKDRKIPIGKFELSNYYANSQVFPLIDEWLHIALQNGVKDLVVKCPLYPLPIFTILGAKSLRELVLVGCTLLPDSLYSGVVSCNSLRKLSLSSVRLDENMFQTLLNSCPLVVSVTLEYCSGLEKIKSDSLKVLKIQYCGEIWEIDAPNLVTLEYICRYQIPQLKIVRES
ncbi:F-box/LRR-repeat protein 25-like, partial [Capsicum annuum]|uniref:F-box/LRR-repeat protein 25-like n=1 Tax=Capsicum annuum TaxID=4072 RepID=UPI001FB17F05